MKKRRIRRFHCSECWRRFVGADLFSYPAKVMDEDVRRVKRRAMSEIGLLKATHYQHESWAVVLRRDPCVYCASSSDTVEHVDPRGSRSIATNGVGACRSCNWERGAAPLLSYLMWRASGGSESFREWSWRVNSIGIRQSQLLKARKRLTRKTIAAQPEDSTVAQRHTGAVFPRALVGRVGCIRAKGCSDV